MLLLLCKKVCWKILNPCGITLRSSESHLCWECSGEGRWGGHARMGLLLYLEWGALRGVTPHVYAAPGRTLQLECMQSPRSWKAALKLQRKWADSQSVQREAAGHSLRLRWQGHESIGLFYKNWAVTVCCDCEIALREQYPQHEVPTLF